MYCSKCGSPIENNQKLCPGCGANVENLARALEELKAGNEAGFQEVYSQTYKYVYHRAKYMTDNEEDALDLIQDVYIALYKDAKKIKSNESLYGWLKTVIFRQGLKLAEKKSKTGVIVEKEEQFFHSIADDTQETEEDFVRQEDVEIIKRCIQKLPEEQKVVLLAYYYDNMKVDEIAEILGISPGTVKSRLHFARKKLKDIILEQEKKQGYKLYSFSAPTLVFAFGSLMEGELPMVAMQKTAIYEGICKALNLGLGANIFETAITAIKSFVTEKILALGAAKVTAGVVCTVMVANVASNVIPNVIDYIKLELTPPPVVEQEEELDRIDVPVVENPEPEPKPESKPESKPEPKPEPEPEPEPEMEPEVIVQPSEPVTIQRVGTLRPNGQDAETLDISLDKRSDVELKLLGEWPSMYGSGTIGSYAKYMLEIIDSSGNTLLYKTGDIEFKDVAYKQTLEKGNYTIRLTNPGTYANEDSALDYNLNVTYEEIME